jgi:pantetheine-phosphate adenylyltransferase
VTKRYSKVAVGGTYDELHKGQEALLLKSFEIGEHITIGLSSDAFVAKIAKPHKTASYAERHSEVEAFLEKLNVIDKAVIVELNDPFGTATSDKELEALVVSKETSPQPLKLTKRVKLTLTLSIITICMIPAETKPQYHHPHQKRRNRPTGRLIKKMCCYGFRR